MARGLISGGLDGMLRRTFDAEATYGSASWRLSGMLTAIGGSLMTLGALIFFVVLVGTLLAGRRGMGPAGVPIAETLTEPARIGWEVRLDRLGLWIGVVILLILCLPAVRDRVPATPSRLAGFRLF